MRQVVVFVVIAWASVAGCSGPRPSSTPRTRFAAPELGEHDVAVVKNTPTGTPVFVQWVDRDAVQYPAKGFGADLAVPLVLSPGAHRLTIVIGDIPPPVALQGSRYGYTKLGFTYDFAAGHTYLLEHVDVNDRMLGSNVIITDQTTGKQTLVLPNGNS